MLDLPSILLCRIDFFYTYSPAVVPQPGPKARQRREQRRGRVQRPEEQFRKSRGCHNAVQRKIKPLQRQARCVFNTVHDLTGRGVGLKVLSGHGAAIDITTAAVKLVFGVFAALAEFERELISERTIAGRASARARGRKGGAIQNDTCQAASGNGCDGAAETTIGDFCEEMGITRKTSYRHVSPQGELRPDGQKLLSNG